MHVWTNALPKGIWLVIYNNVNTQYSVLFCIDVLFCKLLWLQCKISKKTDWLRDGDGFSHPALSQSLATVLDGVRWNIKCDSRKEDKSVRENNAFLSWD